MVWQTLKGFVKTLDWYELGRSIGTTIKNAIKSIDIKSFFDALMSLAIGILKALRGIIETTDWADVAFTLFSKLTEAILTINWIDLATNIIQGLVDGIVLGIELVVGAMLGLCDGLWKAFKDWFKIGSPSKVMEDGGLDLVQGLINGMKDNWDVLKSWLKKSCDNMETKLSKSWDTIKTTAGTKWDKIKSGMTTTSTDIKNAVIGAFNGLKSGLGPVLTGISSAFNNAWATVVSDTTQKFKTLVSNIANAVSSIGTSISSMLSTVGNGIGSAWGSITNFVSSAVGKLSSVRIPRFASGGVITAPTIGMIGEYPGANSNPEIITPESLLRKVVSEGNNDMSDTLIQIGRQIVEAIQDNNTEIKIGDDVISAAAARGAKDYKKRTGRSQFAI